MTNGMLTRVEKRASKEKTDTVVEDGNLHNDNLHSGRNLPNFGSPRDEDIRDILSFYQQAEPGKRFALTEDNGKSWRTATVASKFENTFREGTWRYSVDVELDAGPDADSNTRVIVTRDFEKLHARQWVPRMVVRPLGDDRSIDVSLSAGRDSNGALLIHFGDRLRSR